MLEMFSSLDQHANVPCYPALLGSDTGTHNFRAFECFMEETITTHTITEVSPNPGDGNTSAKLESFIS